MVAEISKSLSRRKPLAGFKVCDCGQRAVRRDGSGWFCGRCHELNNAAGWFLSRVIESQNEGVDAERIPDYERRRGQMQAKRRMERRSKI